jgi:hypothetical protein
MLQQHTEVAPAVAETIPHARDKTLSDSEMNEYTTLTGRTRSSDWSTKIPVPAAPSHPA